MNRSYFKAGEFACKCCGAEKIQPAFVMQLNLARKLAGVPFDVVSGYRCPAHNADVGSRPTSSHPKGWAADIKAIDSRSRFLILKALFDAGFTRIGIGKTFFHVDADPDKDQRVSWLY
jgi:hypothetical protein